MALTNGLKPGRGGVLNGRQLPFERLISSSHVRVPGARVLAVAMANQEELNKRLQAYHGTWIKDGSASDSLDPAIQLIQLNRVMRQAVKLIRGVQLGVEQEHFRFSVFSAIPWFKLSEHYPWTGDVRENRRRDMRGGRSKGTVAVTPAGAIKLEYNWGAPLGGTGIDEFSIDDQGRLRLCTIATVGDESVEYCQIYNRKR